jgi:hypothetical protein
MGKWFGSGSAEEAAATGAYNAVVAHVTAQENQTEDFVTNEGLPDTAAGDKT